MSQVGIQVCPTPKPELCLLIHLLIHVFTHDSQKGGRHTNTRFITGDTDLKQELNTEISFYVVIQFMTIKCGGVSVEDISDWEIQESLPKDSILELTLK